MMRFSLKNKRSIEYCVVRRDNGWMIERDGQFYGLYTSQAEVVREAAYAANYSIKHGLPAEVVGHKFPENSLADHRLCRVRQSSFKSAHPQLCRGTIIACWSILKSR